MSTSNLLELTADEIDAVSGATLLGSLGTALYGANYAVNSVLNTPLISSVGQTFNLFPPVGTAIHQAADTGGYVVFRGAEALSAALGGTDGGLGPIPYHYNTEW